MDFKPTLNLPDPNATIPMKADLPVREPEILSRWQHSRAYHELLQRRENAPSFVLHDGPPYTNSPIHVGTALNKILKDFTVKSRALMGFRTPYVPGFDNHGLPIEQAVMKKFAEKKITPSIPELRQACRDHARTYIALQSDQFQRLGVLGLWEKPYTTMDFRFEAEIVRTFRRMVEAGYVYRGLRPVLWSPTSRTALADSEVIYRDVVDTAITVAFPLHTDIHGLFADTPDVRALIWTTTPWTIPANIALALHPDFTYVVIETGGQHFLLLEDLVEKVAADAAWGPHQTVKSLKGRQIEGTLFQHPLYDRTSVAVLADYVTTEDGTGIVHTAPGHGREDFLTGAKYGLEVLCPVDDRGVLTAEAGEFEGLYYAKANPVICERLAQENALIAKLDYPHSYPHAERDEQPVIFRATEQWFISMTHDNLRDRMLGEIEQEVQFIPETGRNRMRAMIGGRPDWCISRQRPWGVGIPVFFGAESGKPVLDPVAIEAVARLVEREGSDAWYTREPSDILPPGYTHPETGETNFTKETDVFDVWFDSGSTNLAVLEGNVEPEWKEQWPADLYLEGSDQPRGWFNVSLILGMGIHGDAPYKAVVTHGFVTDEKGQKMSKRLGNVVDPVEVCNKTGADVLRWWVASIDYHDDMPCGPTILAAAGEHYRTIRNTLRFLLANCATINPNQKVELFGIHKWAVTQTHQLALDVLAAYERYNFREASGLIYSHCVNTLSKTYLDYIKDPMYCDAPTAPNRQNAEQACFEIIQILVRLLMPLLPFTADEVYRRLPGVSEGDCVLYQAIATEDLRPDAALADQVNLLRQFRDRVYEQLEPWRNESGIKDTQDIAVTIQAAGSEKDLAEQLALDLPLFLKVAEIHWSPAIAPDQFLCTFAASTLPKCERSRLRRPDVRQVEFQGEAVWLTQRDREALGMAE